MLSLLQPVLQLLQLSGRDLQLLALLGQLFLQLLFGRCQLRVLVAQARQDGALTLTLIGQRVLVLLDLKKPRIRTMSMHANTHTHSTAAW